MELDEIKQVSKELEDIFRRISGCAERADVARK